MVMWFGPTILPSCATTCAFANSSDKTPRNSSKRTAPAFGRSDCLTPSFVLNSTRNVTLWPAVKNRTALSALTLRSFALILAVSFNSFTVSARRRSIALRLPSFSFCRCAYRNESYRINRHTGGSARAFTSTRSKPASLARRSATNVLTISCVLLVSFESVSSVSSEVSFGRSLTSLICLAVIWSFTLCDGASRETTSSPPPLRPDMRRKMTCAEPRSANGVAGSGSTDRHRSVVGPTTDEVQPDDAERTPRCAPRR
mmetsp:Transcript_3692/g.15630  ORF Transcript_3692/g.15630 Transcript_3692/m.15630 type:complete len:257 (-) Transcript_3692:132-902(-)